MCGDQGVTVSLQHCSTAVSGHTTSPSMHHTADGWGQVWQLPCLSVNIKILRHYAIVSVVGPIVVCSSSTPLLARCRCPSVNIKCYCELGWAGNCINVTATFDTVTIHNGEVGIRLHEPGQNKEQLSRMIGSVANQSAMGRIQSPAW